MPQYVLVPIDGSEQSMEALDYAIETFPDASITLLTVIAGMPPDEHLERLEGQYETLREERRAMLRDAAEERDPDAEVTTEVATGRPSRAIVSYAEEHGVDQVVLGSHGRSGVTRVLLGSVAETVARRAPCPVTIVR